MKHTLTFCSGVSTVTGANFLLKTSSGHNILVDCGMIQGLRIAAEDNRQPFGYDVSNIDALLVTHAHLDHVGRIPKLVSQGYKGPIYSTLQTRTLAELVLNDAVRILGMEARSQGLEPLYQESDVQAVFPLWETVPYHQSFKVLEGVEIFLKDAGHILGSSMIEVRLLEGSKETIVLFTGDLGNSPAPLLRDTETVGSVDYMIMESVYGDRNHEARAERDNKLKKIILESIAKRGTLVIPSFSIDRTQVLLYELNNMVEKNQIPSIPIFLDSPMAAQATEIYKNNKELFNDRVQKQIDNGDDIFSFPRLKITVSGDQSRDIENTSGVKIIIAGSGMSVGGRVISHEERYLPDSNSTILLMGYQTVGSLGRELAEGSKKIRIQSKNIHVKAKIETLYGYSAHKDGDRLLEFVSTADIKRLKRVFPVMGEPKAAMHIAQRINDDLGIEALMPEQNRAYELD